MAEMVDYACETAASEGLAGPGELIAIGVPFGVAGTTNLLRLERLGEDGPKAELDSKQGSDREGR
jgi:pyruvate kinase